MGIWGIKASEAPVCYNCSTMNEYQRKSIDAHKKTGGKIEVTSKMPVTNNEELAIAYTPGVSGPSLAIAEDGCQARTLTATKHMVAVVSDGSAVLGLGNVGPEAALPVMEGKAVLFKELAGVSAFPIVFNTQNTEEIIAAVKAIAPTFGGINLEDISAPRCFEIEKRLSDELDMPVVHDDQHGTAIVVLAGLINALRVRGTENKNVRIVVNGAGAAGVAIVKILLAYGFTDVIMSDSKGAIYNGREGLSLEKKMLSAKTNLSCLVDTKDDRCATGTLRDSIKGADVFIGVSKPQLLTKEDIETMANDPIVFALSNPEPEILPEEAKAGGARVVATGRSDFPNQVNNALVFPGLFKGALEAELERFDHTTFVRVADALADVLETPTADAILPSLFDKRVVEAVSRAVRG